MKEVTTTIITTTIRSTRVRSVSSKHDKTVDNPNASAADCPKDKYLDNCPTECRTVRDERGCPRCICAERPHAPQVPQEPRPELENTVEDDEEPEEVAGTRYEEPAVQQTQTGEVPSEPSHLLF